MKLPNDPKFRKELQDALRSADRGVRKLIAEEYALRYEVSPRTILNYAFDQNKAQVETEYSQDVMMKISRRILEFGYSTWMAIEEAVANGEITGEKPSERTVNRWLCSRDLSKTDLKKDGLQRIDGSLKLSGSDPMRAEHAFDVVQWDFSLSMQIYIKDTDGSIRWASPLSASKNKANYRKYQVWLSSAIDDYSGWSFIWAFAGAPNQESAKNFLLKLFSPKTTDLFVDCQGRPQLWPDAGDPLWNNLYEHPSYALQAKDLLWLRTALNPVQGLPKTFLVDNDHVIKFGPVKYMLEKQLRIPVIHHPPGHSNVKGKVERLFRTASQFQVITKVKKWESIYEFNLAISEALIRKNHHNTKQRQAATALWVGDKEKDVRQLTKEHLAYLKLTQYKVKSDYYYRFQLDGQWFTLPDSLQTKLWKKEFQVMIDRIDFARAKEKLKAWPEAAFLDEENNMHWAPLIPAESNYIRTGKEYRIKPATERQILANEILNTPIKNERTWGYFRHLENTTAFYQEAMQQADVSMPGGQHEQTKPFSWAVGKFVDAGLIAAPASEEDKSWLADALFQGNRDNNVSVSKIQDLIRELQNGDQPIAIKRMRVLGGTT